MNSFHKNTLGLESVTLGKHVELVVEILVDLLTISVLDEHSSEHAHTSHPQHFLGQSGIFGTSSLTVSGVVTSLLRIVHLTNSGSRVNSLRFLDHKTVLDELTNIRARVRHLDLVRLVGVKPEEVSIVSKFFIRYCSLCSSRV